MRATTTVMWQVRLLMRLRAATGTRAEALQRRALVGEAGHDEQLVGVLLVVVLTALATALASTLRTSLATLAVGELQHLVGAPHVEAADQVEHDAGLGGRRRGGTWRVAFVPAALAGDEAASRSASDRSSAATLRVLLLAGVVTGRSASG